MDWQLIVPGEKGWDTLPWGEVRELRFRPGQPVTAVLARGCWQGKYPLTPSDILRAAQALCRHELASRQEELARGFLPLPGGHRLGVCGEMGKKGLRQITSLCLRMAHEIKGAGSGVYPLIRGLSCLIAGPPGAGKTTLLRDLARLYSLDGFQAAVADERGEIAACRDGVPQMDLGPRTDVLTGVEKARAMEWLIRSMTPQIIVTDEIGTARDAAAIRDALRCGVTVLASAHGGSAQALCRRPVIRGLLREGAFEKIVLLTACGAPPRILSVPPGKEE